MLHDLGDQKQAKEYHERALATRLQKLGCHHIDVSNSYNNLVGILCKLGGLKQAKEYQDRTLIIGLRKLGPRHVISITSANTREELVTEKYQNHKVHGLQSLSSITDIKEVVILCTK